MNSIVNLFGKSLIFVDCLSSLQDLQDFDITESFDVNIFIRRVSLWNDLNETLLESEADNFEAWIRANSGTGEDCDLDSASVFFSSAKDKIRDTS